MEYTATNTELGVEANVVRNKAGFYLTVKDTDAGETLPCGITYPSLDEAIEAADKAVQA